MSATITNPKSDLICQATERRTVFARLALRRRANEHPMAMFSFVVAAAFVWTLVPGEPTYGTAAPTSQPPRIAGETQTTDKTARLPLSKVDRACLGQAWGGETAECVRMIVRENGKADLKVRMIADAAPAGLDTPNVF